MRELRLLSNPEGRKQLLAEYYEQLRQRSAQRETNGDRPGEAWARAQKAGCPMQALVALRNQPADGKALVAARRFCREGRGIMTFLTLLGETGIGKTTAACHVVLDFCRSWAWNEQATGTDFEPVIYADAASLTRLSAFEAADKAHAERLKGTRLLVLEDLGDEWTEMGKSVLTELLMHRDARKRRTVLCSNVTGEPFEKRYGTAVMDRLRKNGFIPNLQGEKSFRQKARAA